MLERLSANMMLALILVGCLLVASGQCQITFVVPPSDVVVARGGPALFNCSITSSVSVSITWQKDGTVIIPSSRITFLSNNSLYINPTETGDDGVYSCVVTSTTSLLSSSQNASLTFAFILSSFSVDPESQTVDEGVLVQLFCIHGGSTPPATISWTLNGTAIVPSTRISITSSVLLQTNPPQVTSTLFILGVQRSSDMGTIQCVATNPLLPSNPVSSTPAILTIRAQPTPPTITSNPINLIVMNGAPASLSCSAIGEPSPTFVWSLNGSIISISGGITVDRRDFTSVLSIASTTSVNTGSYSCRASNSEGAASSNVAQLQIASLGDTFVLEPTDSVALLGGVGVLDCTAPPSIPPAVISWSMNSIPINNLRHRILQSGSLSISATELGDAGMYSCTATNTFIGTAVTSREVSLSVLGMPTVTPSSISVSVGQSAMFSCSAVGSPLPSIEWLKGSNPIMSGVDSRVTISGNSLSISDIVVQDGEYYACRTTLSSLSTTTRAILAVQAPPSFLSPILNLTAILSNTVNIPCNTLPDPALNFTWYFNGMALSPETSGGNLQILDAGTLSISSVAISNAGMYTCMAVNSLGSANGTVFIEVFFLPSVTAASSTVTIVQGATATLQCSSEGNPIPVHSWTRNGSPLAGSRFQVSEDGRTLTISNSMEQDEDIYNCLTSNSVGNVSADVVLEVQVPPSVMTSPPSLTLLAGNTASFNCSATGDPSPQIVWTTSSGTVVSTIADSRYQLSSIPGGGVALTISDLQPSDEQTFSCSAMNVVSSAASTVSLLVLVSPSVSVLSVITGIQGRSLTLDCNPAGRPTPTVTWLQDGTLIQINSRVSINSQGALVFSPLFSTDASSYTCIASNVIGNSSATTSLVVQVAPVIQALTPSVTASTGSSAVLDCSSSGNPIPTITWTFNSAPVLPAGMPRIQQASNNSLLFSQVLASDEGSYVCQAINTAGTESATIELIIHEAPQVTPQSSQVTGIAGASVSLRCTASGDPTPSQTWTRNGVAITDPRFTIQTGGSELLIQSVLEADQGQYQCVASNQAGSGSATVNLNVISVPVVSLPVTSTAVIAEASVVLECGASGDPSPTVAWFYNSVQVPNSATPRITQAPNNSLLFSLVQFSDRGQYVCQATNAAGQDSASLQLTVYVTPTISAEQSSVTAVRGTSVTLTCSASGQPTPVQAWTRNGAPVTTGSTRFQINSSGSSLTVSSVQVADEGTYVCSAANPAGTVTDSVALNVIVPPEFAVLTNSTAIENQQHSVPCLATGDPAPSITWTYNGQVVPSQQGLLTFTPILRTNAGIYTCTASNSAGTISTQIFLNVQYIPIITQAPQDMSVAAGTRVEITCVANGNPAPQISWLFNNTVIAGALTSPYVIAMAAAPNIGTYTCLAANSVGIVSESASLAVFFPPSSPTLLTATPTSSQVISLRWSRSTSDGGSPITAHVLEYRTTSDPSATFQSRSIAASTSEADLDGLVPFVTYEVRVRSENLAGRSPASNTMTVRTHPAAPSAPTGFNVASFTATSLTLNWGMPAVLNGQFGAYELRYGREDTFSATLRDTLLFSSTFTIVGVEMGVVYRMEVRASTRSLIGETLWGPFSVLRVRDGIELEIPTTVPTAPPTTMADTQAPSTPPSATQPPTTADMTNTDLITTEPPPTQPSTTNPPSTQPPTTEILTSEPPSTEILTSEPPSTRLPTTQPPPTEPPTTEAVTTDAPLTTPSGTTSNPVNTPPTGVPRGLMALIPPGTVDEVFLFWMEPMPPETFPGYRILVSPVPPPNIPNPIIVPYTEVNSSYSLVGLASGTTYNFIVATYNSVGLGPLTARVVITTPDDNMIATTSPGVTMDTEFTGPGSTNSATELGETEVAAGSDRDSTYYAIRIVPPVVGVLIIVALVMGIVWCCVCGSRAYSKKTTQKYDVDEKALQKFEVVDQINLRDIPEVEEQVDFAAEYDKNMVKQAFNSNVFYTNETQDSFSESDSDDERQSDQEVLVPYTSAVGRDAVQETEEHEDTFTSNRPVPKRPMGGQRPPAAHSHQQQRPFTNNDSATPAYSLFGGGDIMETRIGAAGSGKSGADYY